jgi:excisionase family DNA binding protein
MIHKEIHELPLSYLRTVHQYLEKVRRRKPDEVIILADVPEGHSGDEIVVAAPRTSKQKQIFSFAVTPRSRAAESLTLVLTDTRDAVPAEIAQAALDRRAGRVLAEQFATIRNRLLNEGLSTPEAAKQLSLSQEGIRKKAARKELLALKLGRDYRFPRWQFTHDSADGIIPGLREVLHASVLDPLELAAWFESEMEALGDRTPIEAIQSGDLDDVVAAAEAAGVS